jgi:hypothetical protein
VVEISEVQVIHTVPAYATEPLNITSLYHTKPMAVSRLGIVLEISVNLIQLAWGTVNAETACQSRVGSGANPPPPGFLKQRARVKGKGGSTVSLLPLSKRGNVRGLSRL